MKKIEYNPAIQPNARERLRDQAHRRAAALAEERFTGNESHVDSLIEALENLVKANSLTGWTPPKRG
jgi:hypothetical protein